MIFFDKNSEKMLIENSLPHNFLAERMLLSCSISNSEALELMKKELSVEAFYFKNHQELYKVILKMTVKKLQIDMVTLTAFLQDNGLLSKIGGIKVLLDLGNNIAAFSYFTEYLRIVKEKFLKRSLIRFGYQIINSGYIMNESLEETLTNIETEITELSNQIRPKKEIGTTDILTKIFLDLKEKHTNPKLPGLSSGFFELDKFTQGFQESDLIIIAGRPSMGKTALSLNLALNCIKFSQLPVLFCSLEMSKEQIFYRILASETGINQFKLRSGKLSKVDWMKVNKILRIMAKLPFFVDDSPNISINEIRTYIKKILSEYNKLGLIIIDYLQLMQILSFKPGNRVQELSQITRQLKSLAREFNVPIIALSQLNRNIENRVDQRPLLSDLRESGSIEQDADLILMLYRTRYPNQREISKTSLTELIIAKQRNGPIGSIKLKFQESRMKFLEMND